MNFLLFLRMNIRWLSGGLLLTFFSSFGQTYFISLFNGEIRHEFDLSHGEFGGIYMFATLASAATLPFLGRIVDVTSVARTCLLGFGGLCVFVLLMANISSIALLFIALYGLRLFGQGMMVHISMTAMARWYATQRGNAISIASIGLQVGEAILPLCFVTLISVIGWRSSWWVVFWVLLLASPIVYALMRTERIPQSVLAKADTRVGRDWTRAELVKDKYFWLVMLAVLAPSFIGTTIFFHQVHIMEVKNWTRDLFASSFFIMSIFTIISGLGFGVLVDKFSAVRLLPVFLIPMAIACLIIAQIDDPSIIFVFMAVFGISYGASTVLIGALWPEIYGTKNLGGIRSIVVALMVFSSALGPGLTGILIDFGVSLDAQLQMMAVYCLLVIVIMVVVSNNLVSRQSVAT